MAILNLAKDKNTKKYELPREGGLIPSVEVHEIHEYSQIKYDLIYAVNEEVFNKENIHVYARKYHSCLFKFVFCESLEDLKKTDISNEKLKVYAQNRSFERFKVADLDLKKEVVIYIFNAKEDKEEVKKYCFLNAKSVKNHYCQYYIYDDKDRVLRSYRELKTFGVMYSLYKTTLYFDLAIPNKEY